ncbi:MAG: glycosyltransferase family 2 protein [Bacteroidota bacterium]
MQQPAVTVLILNWNGRNWLEQFLPSVQASTYPNLHILLADNGSSDDSIAWTQEHFPNVEIAALKENWGFAEGNNRALPYVKTPYVVLLNSDVEVSPAWLEPLVALAEAKPTLVSVQPKVLAYHQKDQFEYAGASGGYMDRFGYPFCRGRIFDEVETDKGQYEEAQQVFWATGACCLLRTEVVQEIGLFDARFFAHMEEIDFCWRAQNLGYEVWVEPKSVVWHVGGGTLPQGNPRKTFLNVRNSLACLYKNLPAGKRFSRIFTRLILDGVWGVRALTQLDFGTILAILKGHFAFYGWLGYLRSERKRIYQEQPPRLPLPGWLDQSIVRLHFLKGVKRWEELKQ